MSLNELLSQPNITISVTGEQLAEYSKQLIDGVRGIYEQKEIPEQYLTRKQTAQMLDIDLSSLWRWNNEQYLCHISIGGRRRYKLSDVQRILNERG